MTSKILAPALFLFVLSSCSDGTAGRPSENNTPKALQEEKRSDTYFSKRMYGSDLVNELYKEQVKGSESLQALDRVIEAMPEEEQDSLAAFTNFDQKNMSYYASARELVQSISDTVLQQRLSVLLESSNGKYKAAVSPHLALLKEINSNDTTIKNLYTALKIVTTLPVLERYQKTGLPSSGPLQQTIGARQKIIDTLQRKVKGG